jgi:Tfp pilus assembly protein PilV
MLLETILAAAIIGIVLTPLLAVQAGIVRNVLSRSTRLKKVLLAKQFLTEQQRMRHDDIQQTSQEQKDMRYEVIPVAEAAPTFKGIANMFREQVTTTWREQNRPQKERLVYFAYKPEKVAE